MFRNKYSKIIKIKVSYKKNPIFKCNANITFRINWEIVLDFNRIYTNTIMSIISINILALYRYTITQRH